MVTHSNTARVDVLVNRSSLGFTLIELVLVIIVLGILAVVAAPKFINISGDARASVVQNIYGSIKESLKMTRVKGLINGMKENGGEIFASPIGDYEFFNGYPETKSEATNPNLFFLQLTMELGHEISNISNNSTRQIDYDSGLHSYENNNVSRVGYGTGNLSDSSCYVEYQLSTKGHSFFIDTSKC